MGYDGYSTDIIISIANATSENIELRIKELTAEFKDETDCELVVSLSNNDTIIFCCKSNCELMDYAIEIYDGSEDLIFEAESVYADDVMEIGCESLIEGVLIKYANEREL
jgi:hypothetical protein